MWVNRFGWHRGYLVDFMDHARFRYFPFTAMQLADPYTYSTEYAANQVITTLVYFKFDTDM
jgi:hypothetical protein